MLLYLLKIDVFLPFHCQFQLFLLLLGLELDCFVFGIEAFVESLLMLQVVDLFVLLFHPAGPFVLASSDLGYFFGDVFNPLLVLLLPLSLHQLLFLFFQLPDIFFEQPPLLLQLHLMLFLGYLQVFYPLFLFLAHFRFEILPFRVTVVQMSLLLRRPVPRRILLSFLLVFLPLAKISLSLVFCFSPFLLPKLKFFLRYSRSYLYIVDIKFAFLDFLFNHMD